MIWHALGVFDVQQYVDAGDESYRELFRELRKSTVPLRNRWMDDHRMVMAAKVRSRDEGRAIAADWKLPDVWRGQETAAQRILRECPGKLRECLSKLFREECGGIGNLPWQMLDTDAVWMWLRDVAQIGRVHGIHFQGAYHQERPLHDLEEMQRVLADLVKFGLIEHDGKPAPTQCQSKTGRTLGLTGYKTMGPFRESHFWFRPTVALREMWMR